LENINSLFNKKKTTTFIDQGKMWVLFRSYKI